MIDQALPDTVRRMQAAEQTLSAYRGRTWEWSAGHTCAHMARFHLRQMGHKPETMPAFRSLLGAKKALEARGWSTVADMLDGQAGLARIMPAMMLPGDLGFIPSEDGLGSICLYLDRHKLAGWFAETGDDFVIVDVEMRPIEAAWRV